LGLTRLFHRLVRTVRDINPDLVILEGGSWALYQWIVLRMLKKAGIKTKIIYHVHNVEYELRKQKENFFINALTRFSEYRLLIEADRAYSVSDRDSDLFLRLYGVRPFILPTSVDIDKFSSVDPRKVRKFRRTYRIGEQSVLFIGSVGYKPNDEAIRLLLETIMPWVVSKNKKAQLVILGGNVKPQADYLVAPGAVPHDDIPSFIAACDLCVAPIISGSGTRLKILEYLACGKAVVSTSKGAEGIALENGKEIVIADDFTDFAEQIVRLLDDKKARTRLGRKGQAAITRAYSWKANLDRFAASVKETLLQSKSD